MPHSEIQCILSGRLERVRGVGGGKSIPGGVRPNFFAQLQCQPIGSSLDPAICSFGETRHKLNPPSKTLPLLTADHVLFITTVFYLMV